MLIFLLVVLYIIFALIVAKMMSVGTVESDYQIFTDDDFENLDETFDTYQAEYKISPDTYTSTDNSSTVTLYYREEKPSFKIVVHTAKNKQKYITVNYVSNGNVFLTSGNYKNIKFMMNKVNELAILLNCEVDDKTKE